MSEHRRKQSQPQNGRRPDGPTSVGRGPVSGHPSAGMPPRRTARPQPGGPGATSAQPRLTRAEMRRAAQGKGGGRGAGGAGGGGRGGQPPQGPKPKRFIDYPRWGKSGVRRWLPSWKLVLSGFLIMFGGLTAVVGYAYAQVTVPDPNAASTSQSNIYYWDDGKTVMASTGSVNRQIVPLAEVPVPVQNDFKAAEDETFDTNSGVDPMSILRAVRNMATGGSVQSGSTITQQYVKNVYLNSAQTATRKLNEILISIRIANGGLSKTQVLTGYLNTNYYGRNAYGIEAAAEAYYGVHASQLNVSQGAFIAATVNEPSTMQNVDTDSAALTRATGRWQYVLNRMVVNKWMTQAEHDALFAKGFPKPIKWLHNSQLTGQVGYLVDMATNYAEQKSGGQLTDAKLAHGGYKIYTTFNKAKVEALESAVNTMQAAHINTKKRSADNFVQVGAASVNPATGEIVAVYGGPGINKGHFVNNANTQGVPVGSTFKPIVLASAIQNGAVQEPGGQPVPITPDSKYNADPCLKIHNQAGVYLEDRSGTSACPEPDGLLHQANDSNTKYGYRTLRYAMEQSINTPYVQLGEDVGYSPVQKTAESLGLDNKTLADQSAGFYIGTSTPNAVRMANVYATFANQGYEHDPFSVRKVTYEDAVQSWLPVVKGSQALSADIANNVTSVLQGVVQSGTGTNAKDLGRPAAGKTGTTDDYKSAWFIGYTPQLATSVVMFKEDPNHPTLQPMKGVGGFPKVFGAVMPTEVWVDYMKAALNGQPTKDFPPAPQLPKGGNETGAPTASPSPSTSSSPSGSASASPTNTQSGGPTPSSSGSSTCDPIQMALGNCTTDPSSSPGTPTSSPGHHHGGGGGTTPTPSTSPGAQVVPPGG
ncbi:transglycosylase domain-containing protein [Streptacidiphilus rugosus]|uniref:transglycosylase domain-containing protein n=1 Tax=Streptacidiphilus rugosus TaxID=405783 RepID=UPI00056C09EE|nr:transglycosylase domain-containing protein [Streptacidiphilus rugosus]